MKYDDASWHYDGDFPTDSPRELGGTHIALFLRWCFSKGWAGLIHLETDQDLVIRVAEGRSRATDFLFKYCDGQLGSDDLSDEGNEFAEQYYGPDGLYMADYGNKFGTLIYVVPEEGHDYRAYSRMLDKRLASGILTGEQAASKPWWRFW